MKKTERKLDIVFLDFDDIRNPLLGAGQAIATYNVGRVLAQKGHRIRVISSKYPGYEDRIQEGIEYTHIGISTPNIKLNNVIFIFALPFAVARIKADIIVESFAAPISTLFSPLWTRIPVVGLPSMFNAIEFTKKYYGIPFHWVERFGIRFYKYLMPYSDIDSGKAKRMNPNITYRIIPQGVGKEFFQIKHKEPKYILFLSRLDIAQKGVDLLLKAYAKVKKKIAYPLVIAGHGPDEPIVRKLIKDLKIEDRVKLVGPAYGAKKADLLASALFTAFPSRHDEMSLWSLESLAAGLPLVGFDLPECKWADESVCLKAKRFDLNAYGNLLVKATDPAVIGPMRKQARIFAKKFSWDHVADEFVSFFTQILDNEQKKETSKQKKWAIT